MITVIDYGLGNISALLNIFKMLNIDAVAARTAVQLEESTKLVLPGVGAFDHAMDLLDRSGMRQKLDELVLERKAPVLGICVGMQILGVSSDEGEAAGLGWIDGRVRSFRHLQGKGLLLPHMGWNDVRPVSESRLFSKLGSDARFYFLHSYYFDCTRSADVVAVSNYGIDFCCAVGTENVYGVQFHPEKSHHFGAQLLKNFAEL
jgi:glutamine amidotransferase